MFTGIIDHCGQIQKIESEANNIRLAISTHFKELSLGESIAIDGACLTVTSFTQHTFTADISPETLRLTIASQYRPGDKVNLERSLRLADRLGGHFVTGHIDGIAKVSNIKVHDSFREYEFKAMDSNYNYSLIKKGSVAINGVSLTLNEVDEACFKVMLVPHTLEKTNLSYLKIGDSINIEFDYLAKLVHNQLSTLNYEK